MDDNDEWVRRSELPQRYPIPIGTWERWAYLGQGPPFTRAGKHTLYRVSDVEKWLLSRRVHRGRAT
jgi:hypothetical protein